jgi:hypothetical protein
MPTLSMALILYSCIIFHPLGPGLQHSDLTVVYLILSRFHRFEFQICSILTGRGSIDELVIQFSCHPTISPLISSIRLLIGGHNGTLPTLLPSTLFKVKLSDIADLESRMSPCIMYAAHRLVG